MLTVERCECPGGGLLNILRAFLPIMNILHRHPFREVERRMTTLRGKKKLVLTVDSRFFYSHLSINAAKLASSRDLS